MNEKLSESEIEDMAKRLVKISKGMRLRIGPRLYVNLCDQLYCVTHKTDGVGTRLVRVNEDDVQKTVCNLLEFGVDIITIGENFVFSRSEAIDLMKKGFIVAHERYYSYFMMADDGRFFDHWPDCDDEEDWFGVEQEKYDCHERWFDESDNRLMWRVVELEELVRDMPKDAGFFKVRYQEAVKLLESEVE